MVYFHKSPTIVMLLESWVLHVSSQDSLLPFSSTDLNFEAHMNKNTTKITSLESLQHAVISHGQRL